MSAGTCARTDCTVLPKQGAWCPKHARQVTRTGSPYRRDELDDMRAGNKYEREMTEALEADPPVIEWRLDPVRRIHVPWSIYDPHAERASKRVAS